MFSAHAKPRVKSCVYQATLNLCNTFNVNLLP